MGGLSVRIAPSPNRLDQGPFGITRTKAGTRFSQHSLRAITFEILALELIGYTWEENGPALGVRCGRETLEQSVEKMALCHLWTCLYPVRLARCAVRARQVEPLSGMGTTFDAAKRHNLGVGFRIQLSSPNIQPKKLSMPDFLQGKVPIVNIRAQIPEHEAGSISANRGMIPGISARVCRIERPIAAENSMTIRNWNTWI